MINRIYHQKGVTTIKSIVSSDEVLTMYNHQPTNCLKPILQELQSKPKPCWQNTSLSRLLSSKCWKCLQENSQGRHFKCRAYISKKQKPNFISRSWLQMCQIWMSEEIDAERTSYWKQSIMENQNTSFNASQETLENPRNFELYFETVNSFFIVA